ncbi:arylsulfatase [Lutimonas halocynthiae]|uniref:arylsulfatase n=1 Tax=Lutimonas halocynthiae TaxID=1446477 RepID=UPI0025B3D3D0|nr:arylsulfatase [Lutimonas halocynthiae]MDN3641156.1 arylsulfatase [Lutimonas halocynthiae]
MKKINLLLSLLLLVAFSINAQKSKKPNILVIMGDDVGIPNLSTYGQGMMGYQTPNIDQIANEGVKFTDYYGEQSCTAGRSAFITGQHIIRTGLSKVGLPGAPVGIQDQTATLGEMLKALGYATGQFGKNHFGDQDRFLPTKHGFDEFFGNLYHLNAEEEPESENWPADDGNGRVPRPRGVIKSLADGPIQDTGPLTKKRMETVDQEFMAAAFDFMERKTKEGTPWFTWMNTTGMHFWTHIDDEWKGKSGLNAYADGMLRLDDVVGKFLLKLKELGVDENTIVIFTTDNGVHQATWPDAGVTWFHGEKTTNWEGGFRVPAMASFPERYGIKPGTIINDVTSHLDWVPTLLAAAGGSDIPNKLKAGTFQSNGKTFKNHLDGHNMLPLWSGQTEKNPREYFIYGTDAAEISAIRFGDRWKAMYMEQKAIGQEVWIYKLESLKAPLLFDLRMDPFEKARETNSYQDWYARNIFMFGWAGSYVVEFKKTFKEFPPAQAPATWNVTEMN